MNIFPSVYIHIGADEVDTADWFNCVKCQARRRIENLKDEKELQGYFIHRIEKLVSANHRKLVGWDEILDAGLGPNTTVMSWRGVKGGIAAANLHHDVVMAASNPLYFNRYQAGPEGEPLAAKYSINSLRKVYDFEPVPAGLDSIAQRHLLGVQAALWTEFISSVDDLEYMLLPRLLALSEISWSSKDNRNWEKFQKKLPSHLEIFREKGLRFYSGPLMPRIK